MAVCTKFKIATWFPSSGLRIQPFSKGHNIDKCTKNIHDKGESLKISQFQVKKSHKCSKIEPNKNCFVTAANAKYMEYLFSKWIKNINSVHKSWHLYFSEFLESQNKTKNLKTSVRNTTGNKSKCESKVPLKVCLDKLSTPAETDFIEKIDKFKLEANDGSITWPPLPAQEQTCVVGHIILSPTSDNERNLKKPLDKPKSVPDLIERISKSAKKTNESILNANKKQVEKTENSRNIKQVTAKDIKEQQQKTRALEQKKRESRAVKKSSGPANRK